MRILHVYRTYYPDPIGGLQEAIRQIALSTKALGVENRIFTLSPSPTPSELLRDEGLVVRSKSWASPASCDIGLLNSIRLFRTHSKWADIIHYHFPWPFADFLHFTTQPGKLTVMTYHSDVVGKGMLGNFYTPIMRRMLKSMNAVVATSPAYIKSSPILKSTVSPQCLRVIPLGIGEQTYKHYFDEAADIEIQSRFGLETDNYFLFIGVLRPYKGLEYLIKASQSTGLPVAIAGDGFLKDQITQLAVNNKNLHLLGQVTNSEKMSLIQGCRALVLPSHLRSEAFGMVLIEAAMCSKPLITCEIGTGTTFVNEHNMTGLVVPPQSPDELAAAMNILKDDKPLADSMGREARARYVDNFSGEALGNAYVKLYNDLTSE